MRSALQACARRRWKRLAVPLLLALSVVSFGRAETVAHWLFDEPAGRPPGSVLRDTGRFQLDLTLGVGGRLVPGRKGNALRPASTQPSGRAPEPVATRARGDGPPRSGRMFPRVTASPLNLGAGDWTIEGWFLLDPESDEEGVIFELGTGLRGQDDLVTRLSVRPRENTFVLAGLAPPAPGPATAAARRVEFANPDGPPGGAATLLTATLAADQPLLRGDWFHAAVTHSADGVLRLWLDGVLSATALADLRALPGDTAGTLALGSDTHARHPFPGAIDELRVSDHAVLPAGLTAHGPTPPPSSR